MTKSELLENMRVQRVKLMEVLGKVPDPLANSPGASGEWSLRDLVAHMLAWEEEALRRLELISAGREQEIRYIDEDELDSWNAREVEAKRGLSWQETLTSLNTARERLLEAIQGIGEQSFMSEAGPVPIYRWLPNLTYAHEEEHLPEIVAWVKEMS